MTTVRPRHFSMLKSICKYIKQKRGPWLAGAFLVVLFVLALISFSKDLNSPLWLSGSRFLEWSTLVVAVLVWFGEVLQDWEEALPKRLDVIFLYEGEPLLYCQSAPLAGEGDVRQLAQQIGSQMSKDRQLQFDPYIQQKTPVNRKNRRGEARRYYQVSFCLTKLPSPKENTELNEEKKSNLPRHDFVSFAENGECLVWQKGDDGRRREMIRPSSEVNSMIKKFSI